MNNVGVVVGGTTAAFKTNNVVCVGSSGSERRRGSLHMFCQDVFGFSALFDRLSVQQIYVISNFTNTSRRRLADLHITVSRSSGDVR